MFSVLQNRTYWIHGLKNTLMMKALEYHRGVQNYIITAGALILGIVISSVRTCKLISNNSMFCKFNVDHSQDWFNNNYTHAYYVWLTSEIPKVWQDVLEKKETLVSNICHKACHYLHIQWGSIHSCEFRIEPSQVCTNCRKERSFCLQHPLQQEIQGQKFQAPIAIIGL